MIKTVSITIIVISVIIHFIINHGFHYVWWFVEGDHATLGREIEHGTGKIGYVVTDIYDVRNSTADELFKIKQALLLNGVIVIKNQTLTRKEQVSFTKALGGIVSLPPSFIGKDQEPGFSEVIHRVTNYWANGTWKGKQHCFGCYWHKDGDFQANDYIASMLYADQISNNALPTMFLDSCALPKSYYEEVKNIGDTTFKVSARDIPDFRNGTDEDYRAYPEEALHKAFFKHPGNNKDCMYLIKNGVTASLLNQETKSNLSFAWKRMMELAPIYFHNWQQGDIVIWDNLAVMHRAGSKDKTSSIRRNEAKVDKPRMLFRTQYFIFE